MVKIQVFEGTFQLSHDPASSSFQSVGNSSS